MREAATALGELRHRVDAVDEQLLGMILERIDLCVDVAKVKLGAGMPLHQPEREAEVREKYRRIAAGLGMSEDFAARLYDLILAEAYRLEQACLDGGAARP